MQLPTRNQVRLNQIWHWISVGKWRRRCIPGSVIGATVPFVLVTLSVIFKDNQEVYGVLLAVRDWFAFPLKMVLYRTFLREYDFVFKYYPMLVIIWLVFFRCNDWFDDGASFSVFGEI